jgi:phosphoribosylamine--glycine ligase
MPDSIVFQAGTKEQDGILITNGGRVLAITSYGNSIREAVELSTYALEQIHFEDMNYRTDIGYEFISGAPVAANGEE